MMKTGAQRSRLLRRLSWICLFRPNMLLMPKGSLLSGDTRSKKTKMEIMFSEPRA
nr:MAG TPA: hypothetical protein [Caudoviricetes sp.]